VKPHLKISKTGSYTLSTFLHGAASYYFLGIRPVIIGPFVIKITLLKESEHCQLKIHVTYSWINNIARIYRKESIKKSVRKK
jgi:hypothetical protein